MDESESYYDVEHSRDVDEIAEACEATDAPIIVFVDPTNTNRVRKVIGSMSVIVGYGEESICDYSSNERMDALVSAADA
jgi:1-deoxy-D-xylulose 5-phosphate reductoisomerase